MLTVAHRPVRVEDIVDVVLDLESDIAVAIKEMGLQDVTVTAVDFTLDEMEGYDNIEAVLDDIVDQLNIESRLVGSGEFYWDYQQGVFVIGFEVTGSED